MENKTVLLVEDNEKLPAGHGVEGILLEFGNLTLDLATNTAFADGKNLLLTAKEFALLFLLARNENKEVSKSFLYEEIWKAPMINDSRSLRTHVCNLREKMIGAACDYTINAVYGIGYCFEKY